MPNHILKKGISVLLKRQTNILTAAYVLMATVIFSQILGLFKQRLLASNFKVSDTLGIYLYAAKLPDVIFQLTIAAALTSAFIPVFSHYLSRGKEKEGQKMASTLLTVGLFIFTIVSIILAIFAPFALQIFNLGSQFSPDQMLLMSNLMRLLLVGQLLFIIGIFFTAVLQSYDHFFIPGIALAMFNLGQLIGIFFFHKSLGIYCAPLGVIIGSLLYIAVQIPMTKKNRL